MSSSELKLSLEWCVQLSFLTGVSRKSPVFMINGNEWIFKIVLHKWNDIWYYELFMELHNKRTDLLPCRAKFEVGIKNEETVLREGEFELVSGGQVIWYIAYEHLWSKKFSDSNTIWLKFLFQFEDSTFRFSKETGDKSIQTSPYIDTCVLLEDISKDFAKLFLDGPDYDIEFICGEDTIKAHKNVLCCRSDVFATMFRTDMIEAQYGQVKLTDIRSDIFRQFLAHLYTGLLPVLTVDVALQLYEAADKYNVPALKKQCASFLVENISPENACKILLVVDRDSDPDFKMNVKKYMVEKNIPIIAKEWDSFGIDNSSLAAEVSESIYNKLREI